MQNGGFKPGGGLPGKFDMGAALEQSADMMDVMNDLYVKLEVKETNEKIKNEIMFFVNGLVSNKFKEADISHAEFAISMLVKMEANSLVSAYKQAIYIEHIIDTLMVRIDENYGGGIGDYVTLMQLQGAFLTLNQHLMTTVRQLPTNIQNTVLQMREEFQIEVQEVENESNPANMIIKSSALLEHIDTIKKSVEVQNAEIDNTIPDQLPEEWILSDEALLNTKTPEEADEYDRKNKIGKYMVTSNGENMPGQKQFDDDEFENDED